MINQFNIGDVVNLGTGNDNYWIIVDMDNLNYSIKPLDDIEHRIVRMAITALDRYWECC
jgi:hypothetical protein